MADFGACLFVEELFAAADDDDDTENHQQEGDDQLETFYKEDGYYRLQPENDTMDPIIVHGDLEILGKVYGVMRFYQ